VSEVDIKGQVIRSFSSEHNDINSIKFDEPYYLVLDDNNDVIVADTRNERIVILKSDLQLKRVLISSLDGHPKRLFFSVKTGLLFVVNDNARFIETFEVL
jgi:hypothetical protein